MIARAASVPLREGVPARDGVGEGVGVPARMGRGETSVGCATTDGGASEPVAVGGGVGRGGVSGDGVVGRLWGDAEDGGNGERGRRAKEAGVGGDDCTDCESVRCVAAAAGDDRAKGAGTLRCVRGGSSGGSSGC